MKHHYIPITSLEELEQAQDEYRWKVKLGTHIPLWGPGDAPMFALAETWTGVGIVLDEEELEDLFDNQRRIYTAQWN